jgi:hypothetical protein
MAPMMAQANYSNHDAGPHAKAGSHLSWWLNRYNYHRIAVSLSSKHQKRSTQVSFIMM